MTTTVRLFSPKTKSALPVIATDAAESLGIAVTATSVVPAGTKTVLPSATLAPDTLKTTRELMFDGV